ncbi:TMAO reductase sytem sensor TorS [Tepidimonas alkaliphilus]|uniref:TMAO reductase sytem sensor TorS n=1 Tax=Tepidimonas alkaliphilus TaxID=2588942 RepID=A0A554WAD3_9BURK|nr:Hpt domain-containing protein [Tepidimonas alkaliphilus]TSE20537.1 TMAO reductase sytem sensor TorS [Tepidimonas alkaliphilus]
MMEPAARPNALPAAGADDPAVPLVDWAHLQAMETLLGQEVRALVQEYARGLAAEITQLKQACQQGLGNQAVRAAHTLKGSSRSVGALAMAAAAAQLEHAARAGATDEAQRALARVEALAQPTAAALLNSDRSAGCASTP